MMPTMEQTNAQTGGEAIQPTSLLDRIAEQNAVASSRYMPVMSTDLVVKRIKAIKEFTELVLVEGDDYGIIPGTTKPTLLKPGAEKICAFFGYAPTYSLLPGSIEDWKGERFGEALFYYPVECTLSKDEHAVGSGVGSCNSWEKKYRYRNGDRLCVECGKPTLIKGKAEYERNQAYKDRGSWVCYEKKGGCGAKYFGDDPAIMGQQTGQVANPEIYDIVNTVRKMADKRAYVAATLSATGASQWFTQDTEDMPAELFNGGKTELNVAQKTDAPSSHPNQQRRSQPADQPPPTTPPFVATDDDIPTVLGGTSEPPPHASRFTKMCNEFKSIKSALSDDDLYYSILKSHGVEHSNEFKNLESAGKAYKVIKAKIEEMRVV